MKNFKNASREELLAEISECHIDIGLKAEYIEFTINDSARDNGIIRLLRGCLSVTTTALIDILNEKPSTTICEIATKALVEVSLSTDLN